MAMAGERRMARYDVEHALRSVPLRVADPELIPAKRYYDSGFFELEKEKLWSRVWQMACRLEEIPEVGDYVEYRLFEKTIIVVRTTNGIRAFHNVCRHRGMRLVEGSGNCRSRGFICPFHGWRYDMDGANSFVFGRKIFSDRVLDAAEIALKPCRVETWGGCAFINLDERALPLVDALGPITQKLDARRVDQLRTEWWYASVADQLEGLGRGFPRDVPSHADASRVPCPYAERVHSTRHRWNFPDTQRHRARGGERGGRLPFQSQRRDGRSGPSQRNRGD
jgi:nitrite reductase/ring-hydroxylating ferredoxin subunit